MSGGYTAPADGMSDRLARMRTDGQRRVSPPFSSVAVMHSHTITLPVRRLVEEVGR